MCHLYITASPCQAYQQGNFVSGFWMWPDLSSPSWSRVMLHTLALRKPTLCTKRHCLLDNWSRRGRRKEKRVILINTVLLICFPVGVRGKGYLSLALLLKSPMYTALKHSCKHQMTGLQYFIPVFQLSMHKLQTYSLFYGSKTVTESLRLQPNCIWLHINTAWALWESNAGPEAESEHFHITHTITHINIHVHIKPNSFILHI